MVFTTFQNVILGSDWYPLTTPSEYTMSSLIHCVYDKSNCQGIWDPIYTLSLLRNCLTIHLEEGDSMLNLLAHYQCT